MVRVEVAPLEGDTAGPSQPYDLVLGENRALPALEEEIMKLAPGQTADADIRFPDDHPDESRRGQSRRVRITLHDVKRQELPALDDAFAREVGDFDTLDALRAAVRTDLEQEASRDADARVREQLIGQIVDANGITAPESLVHKLMHGYANAYQIPEEQLGQFEQQFHPVAEAQVKRDLVLEALVEAHGLRATESDVDARVAKMAEARGVPAGQLYAQLEKAKRLGELERGLTEEKVFDFLLTQSTVNEATP
jgi:trigger factor